MPVSLHDGVGERRSVDDGELIVSSSSQVGSIDVTA